MDAIRREENTIAGQKIFEQQETPQQLIEWSAPDALRDEQVEQLGGAASAQSLAAVEAGNGDLKDLLGADTDEEIAAIDASAAQQYHDLEAEPKSAFSDYSSDGSSEYEERDSEEVSLSPPKEGTAFAEFHSDFMSAIGPHPNELVDDRNAGMQQQSQEEQTPQAEEQQLATRTQSLKEWAESQGYDWEEMPHCPKMWGDKDRETTIKFVLWKGDDSEFWRKVRERQSEGLGGNGGARFGNFASRLRGVSPDAPRYPSPLNPSRLDILPMTTALPSSPEGRNDYEERNEEERRDEGDEWETEDKRDDQDDSGKPDGPARPESRAESTVESNQATDSSKWADIDDEDEDSIDLVADANERFARRDNVAESRWSSLESDAEEALPSVSTVAQDVEQADECTVSGLYRFEPTVRTEQLHSADETSANIGNEAPTSPGAQIEVLPRSSESTEGAGEKVVDEAESETPDTPSSAQMLEVVSGMTEQEGHQALNAWHERFESLAGSNTSLNPVERAAMTRAMLAWDLEQKFRHNGRGTRIRIPAGDLKYQQYLSGLAWDYRLRYYQLQNYAAQHAGEQEDRYDELLHTYNELRVMFNELNDEYEASERRLQEMSNGDELVRRYNELEAQYNEQLRKCSKCSIQAAAATDIGEVPALASSDNCGGERARLEKELAEQKEQMEEQQSEYQAVVKENDRLKKNIEDLTEKAKKWKVNFEKMSSYTESVKDLAEQARRANERKGNFRQMESGTQTMDDFKAELERLGCALGVCKQQLAEFKDAQDQLQECRAHNQDLGAENERLHIVEKSLLKTIETLQVKIERLESDLTSLSGYRESCSTLEAQNEELLQQLAEVKSRKDSIEEKQGRSLALLNTLSKSPAVAKAISAEIGGEKKEETIVSSPVEEPVAEEPFIHHNSSAIGSGLHFDTNLSPPMSPAAFPPPTSSLAPMQTRSPILSPRRLSTAAPPVPLPAARMSQWQNTQRYRNAKAASQAIRDQEQERDAYFEACKRAAYCNIFGKEMPRPQPFATTRLLNSYQTLGKRRHAVGNPVAAAA